MKFIQLCLVFSIVSLFNLALANTSLCKEIDKTDKLNDLISSILAAEPNANFLPKDIIYAPIINRDIIIVEYKPHQINIKVSYPRTSQLVIDEHIALWAKKLTDSFKNGIDDLDDMELSHIEYTLNATYEISRPSPAVISISFNVAMYTGGAHGNTEITTLNYNLETGALLSLEDIFSDPDEALKLMSEFSQQELPAKLKEYLNARMLKDGTLPILENYSSLSLVPNGIIIHFQYYQVAPYVAGQKNIFMPLHMLTKAQPNLVIWGKNI